MKAKKKATKVATKKTTKAIYGNLNEIAVDINTVLRSLITKDGNFTSQEASSISKLYGNQLTFAKLKLDTARMHSTSTVATTKDVLTIGE